MQISKFPMLWHLLKTEFVGRGEESVQRRGATSPQIETARHLDQSRSELSPLLDGEFGEYSPERLLLLAGRRNLKVVACLPVLFWCGLQRGPVVGRMPCVSLLAMVTPSEPIQEGALRWGVRGPLDKRR